MHYDDLKASLRSFWKLRVDLTQFLFQSSLKISNLASIKTLRSHEWIEHLKINYSDNERWNIQQVDDIYTTTLHPHIYRSKSQQSSGSHVQQSTQNKSDFNDIRGTIYGKITNPAQESRGKQRLYCISTNSNFVYENLMPNCVTRNNDIGGKGKNMIKSKADGEWW